MVLRKKRLGRLVVSNGLRWVHFLAGQRINLFRDWLVWRSSWRGSFLNASLAIGGVVTPLMVETLLDRYGSKTTLLALV